LSGHPASGGRQTELIRRREVEPFWGCQPAPWHWSRDPERGQDGGSWAAPLTRAHGACAQGVASAAGDHDREGHAGALVAGGVLGGAHHEGGADREDRRRAKGRPIGEGVGPGAAGPVQRLAVHGGEEGRLGGEVVRGREGGEGNGRAGSVGIRGGGHDGAGGAAGEVEARRQDVWRRGAGEGGGVGQGPFTGLAALALPPRGRPAAAARGACPPVHPVWLEPG
jgi:hypothetical protein